MPRVLVVDDHPPTLAALAALLERDGFDVHACASTTDAVRELAESSFDIVITDFEMPKTGGEEVARAVRTHQPYTCLVVVTADVREHYQKSVDAGACIVPRKPIEYATFMKTVLDCRARCGPGAHGDCYLRRRQSQLH